MRNKSKPKSTSTARPLKLLQHPKPPLSKQQQELQALRAKLRDLEITNHNMTTEIADTTKRIQSRKQMFATTSKTLANLEKQLKSLKQPPPHQTKPTIQKIPSSYHENPHPSPPPPTQLPPPASLPTIKPFKYQKQTETEICMICFEELRANVKCKLLPCGHTLHSDCVDQYFIVEKLCPSCGTEIH